MGKIYRGDPIVGRGHRVLPVLGKEECRCDLRISPQKFAREDGGRPSIWDLRWCAVTSVGCCSHGCCASGQFGRYCFGVPNGSALEEQFSSYGGGSRSTNVFHSLF